MAGISGRGRPVAKLAFTRAKNPAVEQVVGMKVINGNKDRAKKTGGGVDCGMIVVNENQGDYGEHESER